MCEFSHAMGNSNGTLAEYWDAIESTPGLQGGFIWEWRDHGLEQRLPDGTIRHAYGGDFGDRPNDGVFCIDGITFPDRSPKPAMFEHMFLASPVRASSDAAAIAAAREGRVTLENRGEFRDTGWLRTAWEVSVDGESAASGDLPLPAIAPGATRRGRDPGLPPPGRRRRRALADAALPHGRGGRLGGGRPRDRLGAGAAGRRGPDAARGTRVPHHIRAGPATSRSTTRGTSSTPRSRRRRPCPSGAPRPTTTGSAGWRPAGRPGGCRRSTRRLDGIERAADAVTVRATWTTATGLEIAHTQRLAAAGDGRIRVEETVEVPPEVDDLARVGTVLELAAGHEAFEWFGRGPHETYPDRARGGRVGRWRSSGRRPARRLHPAAGERRPRRHALVPGRRSGRRDPRRPRPAAARSPPPTRRPPTSTPPPTTSSSGPGAETIVHIDAAHRGVGTASCGPDTLAPYVMGGGTYRWAWTLRTEAAGG